MTNSVQSGVASEESFSVAMDGDDKTAERRDGAAFSFEDGSVSTDAASQEPPEDVSKQDDVQVDEGGEEQQVELRDLGDFSEDRVEEFDSYYRGEDGQFNKSILTAEFDANKEKGEAGLNAATYDYFAKQGFPKDFVKDVEASLEAQRTAGTSQTVEARNAKLVGAAGGDASSLTAALKWGKESGTYDAAAIKRFNAVVNGGEETAAVEAVELLMSRYSKANPNRPSVPQRDATNGSAAPGARSSQPFKTLDEFRKSKEASRSNPKKLAAHNARLLVTDLGELYV